MQKDNKMLIKDVKIVHEAFVVKGLSVIKLVSASS